MTPPTARFETYTDDAGEWRYRLLASNGENVGPSSQGYRDDTDVDRGIVDHERAVVQVLIGAYGDDASLADVLAALNL